MKVPFRWLTGLLAGTAVLAIILILSGIFDPQPVGEMVWERPLTLQTIPAQSHQIVWLDAVPDGAFSLRLTAAPQSGETDIAYGLALGNDDDFLAITVSPLGYAAVEERHSSFITRHFAFQPWPHVRPDQNEIWLDVEGERLTVRINREALWQGEAEGTGEIGLMMESWGKTAVVNFQSIQLFVEQDPD